MKSYALFSLCACLLALLAGCHGTDPTTGTTTVSGQVVQYQTTKGVPSATVQVYHASSGGGYVPVGPGHPADATGHFAFHFDADSKSGYLLLASAPPGYSTDWALAPSLTAGRSNDNLLIPTFAPAWVKLALTNTSGRKCHHISISGYSGSGEVIYNPRDTVLFRVILSSFKTAIAWGITDQATGAYSQDYQYVQPSALDTVTVRIPF